MDANAEKKCLDTLNRIEMQLKFLNEEFMSFMQNSNYLDFPPYLKGTFIY